jgi:hypothetical protein
VYPVQRLLRLPVHAVRSELLLSLRIKRLRLVLLRLLRVQAGLVRDLLHVSRHRLA